MDIFKEIKRLDLPEGCYLVVGSGIMSALGLRPAKDLDLLVTPDIYRRFLNEGWEEFDAPEGRRKLKKGDVEIYQDFRCGEYRPREEELIRNAQTIGGVSFLSLQELLKFKKTLGREKDVKDLELIENYFKNQLI